MKVLDATFLIDYLDGHPATETFYEEHGGPDEQWIVPVPAYAEVLVGEGNFPDGDVRGVQQALAWIETYDTDADLAVIAAEIADAIPPGGPYLDGPDALVAAVGRELNAPVVAGDSDLTHESTQQVIAVETYRD